MESATSSDRTRRKYVFDAVGNRLSFTIMLSKTGDLNGDDTIDLEDALMALQICSGITPSKEIDMSGAISPLGKVDMTDAVYILNELTSD